jgi:NADPH:quinone reductase-like Zn-dependent oxidoreductase
MRGILLERYVTADQLVVREVERPQPAAGEVLVRVHAAGVNPADWHLMRGDPYLVRLVYGLRRPKFGVLGSDVAGTIESVGANVTEFAPGDVVYSEVDTGGYAEYVAIEAQHVARAPSNLTYEQAAAVPMAAMTALQSLRDAGRITAGHRVLVNGASGGIGTFAVQLATELGASVTGVCSTPNVELVRSLGAVDVIDYTRDDFTRGGDRYDVVLDLVGNRSLRDLARLVAPGGTYVAVGAGDGRWLGPIPRMIRMPFMRLRRVRMVPFLARRSRADLDELRERIEAGTLRPIVERAYPLDETAAAVAHVESGRARGKVVIRVV